MPNAIHIRKAFKQAIESQAFAQKLQEVWNEHPELGEVEYPNKVYRSQTQRVTDNMPAVEIDLTISRNTDNRNNLIHLQHEVHIFWHTRGDDEELLDDKVAVYLRATREYFMENPYLEGLGNPEMVFGDDQYSPFVPENVYEGRPLIKSGLFVILVETLDDGRY